MAAGVADTVAIHRQAIHHRVIRRRAVLREAIPTEYLLRAPARTKWESIYNGRNRVPFPQGRGVRS